MLTRFEPSGIVTLLTDFGLSDTYVGQMHGVLLSVDPTLRIVNLTHQVSPQDIAEGAFQLATALDAFPAGCVHVAVVDPGVGTARRAIVVQTASRLFVAPDNGVLSYVLEDAIAAYAISGCENTGQEQSSTFHGRDIFAPVAGRLASGQLAPKDVGPAIDLASVVRLPAMIEEGEGVVSGPIAAIDHFGNCLTMIRAGKLPAPGDELEVVCGRFQVAGLSRTYSDVEPSAPLALIGSNGAIELSVRDGNAARSYGLARGDRVTVRTRRA